MTIVERTESFERRGRVAQAVERLRPIFGERLSLNETVLAQHGQTTTWLPHEAPDIVVFAETTSDVVAVVAVCRDLRLPVVPYGVGTSLEGQVNAPFGGVTIDFSRMNRILAVHAEDLDCVVEPGVTRTQLNAYLRDQGLFFPIDPGADASLGGMVGTRASGTNAVRYGTMRENVIALTAVMADGSVVRTQSRARKSSSGYDLTRLLVGSEGTLGIVTEITLRLHGLPEAIISGVCPFGTIGDACNAVIATIQSGLPVARIEFIDELGLRAVNRRSHLDLPETPTLFLEFHGTEASVAEQAARFGEIAAEFGGGPFRSESRPEDRNRLWHARHEFYWASRDLRPGTESFVTDACVPISRLAECVTETMRDLKESDLVATVVGHVGDGNFHTQLLVDMSDAGEVERAKAFVGRLAHRAIAMDGTCTGEHGVGQGKMKYLIEEHGPGLAVMAALKRALDPLNVLNPGKILPDILTA